MTEVTNWYKHKNIFVTGATGFVGKCLVEKLLRDCPDIGLVYIMIRQKSGLSFTERKASYTNHVVFSHLKSKRPWDLEKLRVVQGDLNVPQFGMSEEDLQETRENVRLIFHSAADVRFDRPLTDAYETNVMGTKHILEFARTVQHLEVFVYVSTAFSQTHDIILEEKYYPAVVKFDQMEKYVRNLDSDLLDALSHKILGKFPNTYGFTKCLSEDLVYQYRNEFPIAIGRPTIIISTWKEPLPGYTEGMHGINGWSLAVGRGVLRTMHCQRHFPCNVIQCDLVVNGLAVLAYERSKMVTKEPLYFNIAEGMGKPMSWNTYINSLKPKFFTTPFNFALWLPGGSLKSNYYHNLLCQVLLQIVPALFIDFLLIVFWQRPIMIRVQNKISAGLQALSYYLNHKFMFKTHVYNDAFARLSDEDRAIFFDRSNIDINQFFSDAVLGTKIYLVKEKKEDMPRAHAFMRKLKILDVAAKVIFILWLINTILQYLDRTFF